MWVVTRRIFMVRNNPSFRLANYKHIVNTYTHARIHTHTEQCFLRWKEQKRKNEKTVCVAVFSSSLIRIRYYSLFSFQLQFIYHMWPQTWVVWLLFQNWFNSYTHTHTHSQTRKWKIVNPSNNVCERKNGFSYIWKLHKSVRNVFNLFRLNCKFNLSQSTPFNQ